MALRLRRAVEPDLGNILAVCRAFHAESPTHSRLPFDEPTVLKLVSAALDNPDWLASVVIDEDRDCIAGMMLLYAMPVFFSKSTEVGDLTFYVAPDYRGSRAAFLMWKEAKAWAQRKGAARMQIGVTTGINNDSAIGFFQRLGMEVSGTVLEVHL